MNRLPRIDLAQAMENVDFPEPEVVQIGEQAVVTALEVANARQREEQRQRDIDAALADAIEMVARQRARVGRRVCSARDGETVRRVHELLRAMAADSGADGDPSFQ